MEQIKNILSTYHELITSDESFRMAFILIAIIGVIIWLGTASMIAEFAEERGVYPGGVFIIGVILPLIGPGLCFLYLSGKAIKQHRKSKQKKEDDSSAHDGLLESLDQDEEENQAETAQEDFVVLDQDYFIRKVNRYGEEHSYKINAGERLYKVNKIFECLPSILVCEVEDEAGKVHRMRLPYAKMTNVHY